jgi:hypothetical protein
LTVTLSKVERYDPKCDLGRRWPHWNIKRAQLNHAQFILLPESKVILVDIDLPNDILALAEAVAHLDCGHHRLTGWLSAKEQLRAEWLALARINEPDLGALSDIDGGDPTVRV